MGTGSEWVEAYVNYAEQHGFALFSAEDLRQPVTRGEAAEIFAKVVGQESPVINKGTNLYRDVQDESAPYYDSIYALYRYGIMIGDKSGNFNPDSPITRAEAAVVAVRAADELSRAKGEIAAAKNLK